MSHAAHPERMLCTTVEEPSAPGRDGFADARALLEPV